MKKLTNKVGQHKIDLQALKESEARFRNIVLWSPDAIIVTDAKGKIEYMNPAAEGVFNRKVESFIGKDFGLPLVDGESAEIDIFRPRKDPGVGDMHVVEIEWLNKKAHLITIRDITDRKRAEETLKVSETRYRRLFETAQDGILILDAKTGQISDVNPFLIDMLGYSHQEFVGKKLWDIGVFKDRVVCKKAFWELQTKGFIRYEDLPLETKDGQHIEVEFVSNVYQINGEEVIQCNIRNITDRKRFEAVKDDFVSMVSHELRTPLTSIREAVSQTLDGILGEVSEQQREILAMALSDIDRLTRLINDLLDVSKIDAGKMKMKIEVCEMVALVKKLISSFIPQVKAKGLEMEGSFSEEKIKAYVDRDRITQVFSNLIGNAVKFTQKGRIQVSLLDREDAIECSVSDTGPGIAKKDFAHLFDKFQQFGHQVNGEEKGTGLGLAVSKGIVELHKGRIWVESQVNAGTKFTFALPKFTGKELISDGLKKAIKEGQPLSVLIFNIKNPDAIQKKMGKEKVGLLINNFWELIKENLRRDEDDLGIQDLHTILTILPGTEKESAASALERMSDLLRGYLLREGIEEEIELVCENIAYPEDGKTEEELLSRLENILATKGEVEVSSK
jgi:PAS domain S-box-containing protein